MIDPISGKEYPSELLERAVEREGLSYEFLVEEIKKGKIILLNDGSILRRGYTTGTCASAASKAATQLLLGIETKKVNVTTPVGIEAEIDIENIDEKRHIACVQVDSGDYKGDVFNGMLICAKAKHSKNFTIKAGEGIGTVKRGGMGIKVGEPDVFPHILRNIEENVKGVLTDVEIEIFVPNGREIAKNTPLSDLGIVDGVPLFGTTGFIEPYTESSYMHVIDFLVSDIRDFIGICTGRTSKRFAIEKLNFPEENIIVAGNFVYHAIKKSNAERKVIFGLPAKICDLLRIDAQEHFDLEFDSIGELVNLLKESDQISELSEFFDNLAKKLSQKTGADVYVFDHDGDVLGAFSHSDVSTIYDKYNSW